MTKSNIILICASPRRKGTSVMLLERIRVVTGGEIVFLPQKGSPDKLISDIKHAETIVISGPCYINTYPAKLIELLETASAAGGFTGQKIYGIINGGMPYIHTHQHGLTCLKLFAEQNNLFWQGGFILGGGAMLDGKPLENHMGSKKVVPAFDRFILHIAEGSPSPDSLYRDSQSPPGKIVTRFFASLLSSITVKRIKKYGHDPKAPNWHLREQ